MEEAIECTDAGLIFAQADKRAVATEDVRLRHRQWNARLAGITQYELAGLDRPTLPRQRFDAAAFDWRLIDAVFVTQRVQVARLCAEVQTAQYDDTREAFVLRASHGQDAAPLFL